MHGIIVKLVNTLIPNFKKLKSPTHVFLTEIIGL
jgi:hypothetical protein